MISPPFCRRAAAAASLAILAGLCPRAVPAQEPDYRAMYEQANQSALMWKERAALLERENETLKAQLARARAGASGPAAPAPAASAPGAPARPTPAAGPVRTEVEIPTYGAVNLESYGGPSIKVNVWTVSPMGALVQVGNEAKRQVEFGPDGRVMIHRDAAGAFQINLLNSISSPNTVRLEIVRNPSR